MVTGDGSEAQPVGVTHAVQFSTDHCGDNGTSVCLGGIGQIADGEMAGITWSVNGPGLLSFCWRVESEASWDILRFYVVGAGSTNEISGIIDDWDIVTRTLGGTAETLHTFRWEYEKDPDGDYVGADSGWVDALSWTPFYALDVVSGSGGGAYSNGTVVTLQADNPSARHLFDRWVGDTNGVADVLMPTTTITMTASPATVTASYRDILYPFTVVNGSGSGEYAYGAQVMMDAEVPVGKRFYQWTGDVATVSDCYAATTTATALDQALRVVATYQVPLTVVNGFVSGWYLEGTSVPLTADPAPLYQTFDHWQGDETGRVTDVSAASTLLMMPTYATTLTATYRDSIARLLGCYGRTFVRDGVLAGIASDTTTEAPSGTSVVKLGGPGIVPNNGFVAFESHVFGSGTVSFWWKTSSELNADFLCFYVDGVQIAAVSGTKTVWTQVTHLISTAGVWHTLRWAYIKNASTASSSDAAWVDDLVWVGDAQLPLLSPEIDRVTLTNGVFTLDFLGERGMTYQVQTNPSLLSGTWGSTLLTPQYISETNGTHCFKVSGSLIPMQESGFFRISTGTEE